MATEGPEHKQLQEYMRSQEWNSALEVAFQLLKTQPESSWLHIAMGKIYSELQELTYAETSFKSAIYYHPQQADSHIQLGLLYLRMNRIGSADDHCKKALALDSSDLFALILYFKIKLAYSDLPAAKDCYANIQRLSEDQALLSELRFNLISHPANKEPIDFESEIATLKELVVSYPLNHSLHAQLAYLYNRFTKESDLAEMYIHTALRYHPSDPQITETSILIQRKKNIWLRILTAPAHTLSNPLQISKNEIAAVGLVFLSLILFSSFGSQHPWMTRAGVFSIIAMFYCSYTANLAFQYLHRTEIVHRHGKTSHFKEPFRKIHCLPFHQRILLTGALTILSWAVLALSLFLITR